MDSLSRIPGTFNTAAITAAESLHAVERATPAERRIARSESVEQVISHLPVIDFDLPVARTHARLWAMLVSAGQVIGPHDFLIAATALEHECQIATLHVAEFKRVAGLRLANI